MNLSDLPIAEVSADGKIDILRHIYFKCSNCADCCKLNNIPITEQDIELIMENGFEVGQFIEELSPILIASKNLDRGLIKAYILRKKPFVNECVFLDEKKMCKIHSFKPLTCQLYPFSIRRKDSGYTVTIHPDCVCNFIQLDVPIEKSNTLDIVNEILVLLSIKRENA
ncbi:MAG: YkgJ family cysteine cluster protein [Candidatus Heimdallarchaeaceae archaeon]